MTEKAPITRLLLGAIVLAFGVTFLLGGANLPNLVRLGANVPELVLGDGEWWRLLTSMFLHGGLWHLALNGLALYQLGGLFESWTGSRNFTFLYFVSGLVGSLASTLVHGPLAGPDAVRVVSVGASGAIFGLLGGLIALLAKRRERLLPRARSLLFQLALWAGLNILLGFTGLNLDNAAHLGGFVAGLLIGFRVQPFWETQEPEYQVNST